MKDERKEVIEALAWDLVACGGQPPLHPTTCAVMRILFVFQVVPFSVFAGLMPCDTETTRQQLRRLKAQGVVDRLVVRQRGRHAVCLYALTPEGRRIVKLWEQARNRLLSAVNRELRKV